MTIRPGEGSSTVVRFGHRLLVASSLARCLDFLHLAVPRKTRAIEGLELVARVTQTTECVAQHERWEYWKDTCLAAVDASVRSDPSLFNASRTVSEAGIGTLIETTSEALTVERPKRKIARDGIDHACLVIALAGSGVIDQANRSREVLRPGDLTLYDLGRPHTATLPEPYRELRLNIPRDLFASRIGPIETLSGLLRKGGDGLTDLFTTYARGYAAALPSLDVYEAAIGMDGLLHLLSNLVSSSVSRPNTDVGELAPEALRAVASRHIDVLLGDPMFDVAALSRALGVSRSRLYNAFVEQGGVASAIRQARLDRARLAIEAPATRDRTLESIARLCGFSEYLTFTRAFRRRFGVSPSDMRAGQGPVGCEDELKTTRRLTSP